MFALLNQARIKDRDNRLALISGILHRPVFSTSDMNDIEVHAVVDILDYWKRSERLEEQCLSAIAAERTNEATVGSNCSQCARSHDERGYQLVQVQFEPGGAAFTYSWVGEGELAVGDQVETPPKEPESQPGVATVCALGSHYDGTVTALKNRIGNK